MLLGVRTGRGHRAAALVHLAAHGLKLIRGAVPWIVLRTAVGIEAGWEARKEHVDHAAGVDRAVGRGDRVEGVVAVAVRAACLLRRGARARGVIAAPEAQEAGTVLTILVRADAGNAGDHEGVGVLHVVVEILERTLSYNSTHFAVQALYGNAPLPQLLTSLVGIARPVFANVGAIAPGRGAVAALLGRGEARELQSLLKRYRVFGDAGVAVHDSSLQRR